MSSKLETYLISYCLIFLLAAVFVVGDGFYSKQSGVINVDSSNFDSIVAANEDEVVIIEFYAPWCGHCKQLKPEYIKLAKALKNVVRVVAMDASDDKNRGIAGKYGVQGFPTLKVHVGTNDAMDYSGARDSNSMKRFLLDLLPNYSTKISSKKLDSFLKKNIDKPRALVFGKKDDASPTFRRFSALLKGHMVLGVVKKKDQKEIGKKYDISVKDRGSVLMVFKPNDNEQANIFNGNTKSFKEVQTWLYSFTPGLEMEDSEALPKLLDHSCYVEKCEKKGLCVILIAGEDEGDYIKTHTILKEIEETSSDASLFAFSQITASAGDNYIWLESLFGNMDTYYSNIIVLAPQKKRYAHYVGSVTSGAIKGFISGVLTGRTRTAGIIGFKKDDKLPTLGTDTEYCKPAPKKPKKKAKPQQQPGGGGGGQQHGGGSDTPKSGPGGGSQFIVTINNDNWQQIIYGNNQPLIVEFYAPWCGHCKSLAPEFAAAATALKGMVLFGAVNCDSDSNRQLCGQFNVQGFPTLKIFPHGRTRKQKNGPKDYQGQRTASGLERAALDTLLSIKIPSLVSNEDYNEFLNMNSAMAKILLFSSKKRPPALLRALAAAFDTVSFAMINENQKELINKLNINKFPTVTGYIKDSENAILYNGKKTFIELTKWIVSLMEQSKKTESVNHEEL